MNVVVCETKDLAPVLVDFRHIDRDYAELGSIRDPQWFWQTFMNVVRYEDYTCRLIAEIINGPEFIDRLDDMYDIEDLGLLTHDPRDLPTRCLDNYLFRTFFPDLEFISLQELKSRLELMFARTAFSTMADIYGQDIYNLTHPGHRSPVVLFSETNEYLGHFYRMRPTPKVEFIGIRESLTNLWRKTVKSSLAVYNIAYVLLNAAGKYVRFQYPHEKKLRLCAPIGQMPRIAMDYGFGSFGETMSINAEPEVDVHPYALTFLN